MLSFHPWIAANSALQLQSDSSQEKTETLFFSNARAIVLLESYQTEYSLPTDSPALR